LPLEKQPNTLRCREGGYLGKAGAFQNSQERRGENGTVACKNAICKIYLDFWSGVTDRNNGIKARAAVEIVIRREIKY